MAKKLTIKDFDPKITAHRMRFQEKCKFFKKGGCIEKTLLTGKDYPMVICDGDCKRMNDYDDRNERYGRRAKITQKEIEKLKQNKYEENNRRM